MVQLGSSEQWALGQVGEMRLLDYCGKYKRNPGELDLLRASLWVGYRFETHRADWGGWENWSLTPEEVVSQPC